MDRARLNTPLKQALDEDGRRQQWLADRLGVDKRQVWGWVHGLHVPADETQAAIAAALHRDVNELFPPENPPERQAA
ncbi:MAG TPA: helix-turn-helix transcriptional regulator [Solirubrobacteraceae bacterium]|nr:helix-turn-helix transcriptional regulator [Solirubrobacteraceae bacterium]